MNTHHSQDLHPWIPEEDTCSNWEHMGYWLTVLLVTFASVGVVCGVAGYVYYRWVA